MRGRPGIAIAGMAAITAVLLVPLEAPVAKTILVIEEMFDRDVRIAPGRPYTEAVTVAEGPSQRLSSLVVLLQGPRGARVDATFGGRGEEIVLRGRGRERFVVDVSGVDVSGTVHVSLSAARASDPPVRALAWFLKSRQPVALAYADALRGAGAARVGVWALAAIGLLAALGVLVARATSSPPPR